MLQTIYEADSCFFSDSIGKHRLPHNADMHNVNNSVDIKPEVPQALDSSTPLDLRTDVRMQGSGSEVMVWERQLQQELLLIQKQQQIQKQLLISEFQKQHENLVRQHQAQIQEHLKLQQELHAMKQQQEQLEKERKLELQSQERELERHRREQQVLALRCRERSRESAVASNEVKLKLQEFLLSKSTKDAPPHGLPHKITHGSKLWYTASHHTSLEQSSPPLGGALSSCKISLASLQDCRDDFPLRKTAHSSIHLNICPSIHLNIYPYVRPPVHPSIHRPIHPSISTSVYPSIYLSVHQSILPSEDPSIHLTNTHRRSFQSPPWPSCCDRLQPAVKIEGGQRERRIEKGSCCSFHWQSTHGIMRSLLVEADSTNSAPEENIFKTLSEPNLKVRSRLKQKVAERRSSPLLRRKEGSIMTPFKKRALELLESSTSSSSAPGSGPSSPNGACSALGAENGPSSLPVTTRTERWPSQSMLLGPESSMSMLNLYTSPSLPNISLGLSAAASPISATLGLQEKHAEGACVTSVIQGIPAQILGPVPLSVAMETKVSSSHQALLQHLLQKEQLRHQKILSSGHSPVHPPSPLAMMESPPSSVRPKLPRHRPLNRTQSAPLPQSTLAQLVIQQQHQHFLEKQKQYQQQVHINKLLSKSIEQLRQPNVPPQESEEEEGEESRDQAMQEDSSPSAGVIRKHSPNGNTSPLDTRRSIIRVKEEPVASDDETMGSQSPYIHQVKGRMVIQAMI
ncbi:hypothetical protein DNTS_034587 [Danionella cerebrum]|uniref:histone deacetylase n=1 Tax=Danionella cerebrum TaxID=2873325 RepID=A0A553MZZ0_9TELE|nr:hypothetical protein DNTS_034587 [Danionella translucida]